MFFFLVAFIPQTSPKPGKPIAPLIASTPQASLGTKDLDLLSAGSQSHLADPNAPRDGARDARDGRAAHDSRDARDGGDAQVGLGGVVGSRVARGEGKSGGPPGGAEEAFGNSEKKGGNEGRENWNSFEPRVI